jgi:hypothetical protein
LTVNPESAFQSLDHLHLFLQVAATTLAPGRVPGLLSGSIVVPSVLETRIIMAAMREPIAENSRSTTKNVVMVIRAEVGAPTETWIEE